MSLKRIRAHAGYIALAVNRGVETPRSGGPPACPPMGHYTFTTADDCAAVFMPHAPRFRTATSPRQACTLRTFGGVRANQRVDVRDWPPATPL